MEARMMNIEHWKQRHKEIRREAERNHLAKALRAARKRHAGRTP